MAVEIIMPKLGVDMQEGEIIEWKKQVRKRQAIKGEQIRMRKIRCLRQAS